MLTAPPRKDEAGAIAALRHLGVLDTGPEAEFDALVRAATLVCGTPVSLISLVDSDRQWFKANVGLPGVSETPRELAFCAHAVLGDTLFEVPDATQDPRFADNPLVSGHPDIRFYAGAPVRLSDGHTIGTLCVIDRQPRQLNAQQREIMMTLADAVAHALEGRRALRTERAALQEAARAAVVLQHSADAVISLGPDGSIREMNRSAERLLGYPAAELVGQPYARLVPDDLQRLHHNTMQGLALAGHALSHQTRRIRRDGAIVHVAATLVPELGPGGELRSATDFLRDISAQVESANELAVSAARFRHLSDCAPVGVYHSDAAGRCTYTNARLQEIYGLSLANTLGSGWLRAIHPDDRNAVQQQLERVHQNRAEFEMPFRIQRVNDGAVRWVRSRGREVRGPQGELQGYVGTIEDVTDAARAQLAENELLLAASVFQSTVDGIAVVSADGQILSVNPAFSHITGYAADEAVGHTLGSVMPDLVTPQVQHTMQQALQDSGRWAGEVWNRRRNGDAFLQWQTVTAVAGVDGGANRLVYVFNDITERRQLDAQLHHLAFHDPLTDLPNRSLLMERANQLIQMRARERRQLAMMYLDLDGFKSINDRLGHAAGDHLLKQVAGRLLRQVRQSDTVARLGGDEFVLLLDNPVGLDVLTGIADRTIEAVRGIDELAGAPVRIGVSIGIALLASDGETAADLLHRADEAMYQAKADGKNRYCFHAAGMSPPLPDSAAA